MVMWVKSPVVSAIPNLELVSGPLYFGLMIQVNRERNKEFDREFLGRSLSDYRSVWVIDLGY